MKNIKYIHLTVVLLIGLLASSCMHEWLDSKPDKQLVVPSRLKDFQAIMDNSLFMNYITTPSLFEMSADDYSLTSADWSSQSNVINKNAYVWKPDIFEGKSDNNWNTPYRRIYYANVTIEGVNKITRSTANTEEWNNVMGSALFFRAESYSHLIELFAVPYDKSSAATALGVPLKIESDINVSPQRGTVQQTYDLIIDDLETASALLPVVPVIKTRPSRPAAYGLLARVYLQMGDYTAAYKYADLCLKDMGELLDYNDIDPTLNYPISKYNDEVIFNESMIRTSFLFVLASVDSVLFGSYEENDLRKNVFFMKNGEKTRFKGTYEGENLHFTGITTGEIYLIRAESAARLDKNIDALKDLNHLLKHRYKKDIFQPLSNLSGIDLLKKVLLERRKELLFRGLRWKDLRRLNKDSKTATRITRTINDVTYHLEPNDKLYVFPIPDDIIDISGIVQNER